MKRAARLLSIVLLMPALGYIGARGLRSHFESKATELKTSPLKDGAFEEKRTPGSDFVRFEWKETSETRKEYAGKIDAASSKAVMLRRVEWAALASAALGLATLFVIRAAGSSARTKGSAVAANFGPGLRVTAIVVIVLIALNAAILLFTTWYGVAAVAARTPAILWKVMAAAAIGAVASIVAVGKSMFSALKVEKSWVFGESVPREAAPELWKRVDRIAENAGTAPPDAVVLGCDPNFFVTDAPFDGPTESFEGRTIFVSASLMRTFTPEEFDAVLGHEFGHCLGDDFVLGREFHRIYRRTCESLAGLHAQEGVASWSAYPARAVLEYFLESFAAAERRSSREREFEADRVGVESTDARTSATALVKVSVVAGFWGAIVQNAAAAAKEGKFVAKPSWTFAKLAEEHANKDLLKEAGDASPPHPFDTHPPTSERLRAMGFSVEDVAADALKVAPSPSAADLVPDLDAREERLGQILYALVGGETRQAPTPRPIRRRR